MADRREMMNNIMNAGGQFNFRAKVIPLSPDGGTEAVATTMMTTANVLSINEEPAGSWQGWSNILNTFPGINHFIALCP